MSYFKYNNLQNLPKTTPPDHQAEKDELQVLHMELQQCRLELSVQLQQIQELEEKNTILYTMVQQQQTLLTQNFK
jgi:hypothetical protein